MDMRRLYSLLASAAWLCGSGVSAQDAAPLLASVFQDHAVLQRERPISVWGSARPGERVTVTLNGKTVSAPADPAGRWEARLSPMTAGGPYTLTATTASGASQTVDDANLHVNRSTPPR
jgi:sialate O-acetylesterase